MRQERMEGEGIVMKLDFEKAYDKVHWMFMLQCLAKRGFCETWCV
jgi:hypothetical protein